jgi:hypothetical protein
MLRAERDAKIQFKRSLLGGVRNTARFTGTKKPGALARLAKRKTAILRGW